MTDSLHDPYRQSTLLSQAISSDKMRIAFMLGAGCPVSVKVSDASGEKPLIPDIKGLTSIVRTEIASHDQLKPVLDEILGRLTPEEQNIEAILTHIRLLGEVIQGNDIENLSKEKLAQLDEKICEITTRAVSVELPDSNTPYHQLAKWIGGVERVHPVEIFTPNYDLLIEQALEDFKVPFFDGFVGSKNPFFDLMAMDFENENFPARWGRLWKIHGSINWWKTSEGDIVRRTERSEGDRQMIHPSHLKYDQSRRMPYLAMLDRLRSFLARGQGVLITCGYSFSDQHLNEVILDGLRSNPKAICFGLLYGERSNYLTAINKAKKQPNLNLFASDGAVIGTRERAWQSGKLNEHRMHGLAVTAAEGSSASGETKEFLKFALGNFYSLGNFLEQQLSQFDRESFKEENA